MLLYSENHIALPTSYSDPETKEKPQKMIKVSLHGVPRNKPNYLSDTYFVEFYWLRRRAGRKFKGEGCEWQLATDLHSSGP